MKTIAAISSPIGAGGIGIVRISGSEALEIADAVFCFAHKTDGKNLWSPMMMNFGTFLADGFSDKGYAVFFPKEKAYTGEDTVEFYLHGGVRIMQGALDTLIKRGARLATAGEFTKKAFLAGRLSLADAEGVMDMINADSAAALHAAYRLMDGKISGEVGKIADGILDLIAGLEATLDYPEETEDEVLPPLKDNLLKIKKELEKLIDSAPRGKRAKYGVNAVLAGGVNAGKSSLMNAMLKCDRAIVTELAGTTRDTVEDSVEVDGVKINLVDTAGIRDTDDTVEAKGVDRAKNAVRGADVILHVIDKSGEMRDDIDFGDKLVFTVYNKCDVAGFNIPRTAYTFGVSAKTGEGVDNLLNCIAATFKGRGTQGGEVITNERHVSALQEAHKDIENAVNSLDYSSADCTLIDLKHAYDALGEITGKTASEDVVNAVFSKFCVGK